jgi:uncharacterized SAM-binding protein YcdF (DUF218 family)
VIAIVAYAILDASSRTPTLMAAEIIKQFLLPSGLMALFLLAGVGCLMFQTARRKAVWLFFAGGGIFLIFSNGPLSFFLIKHLEDQHQAFNADLYPTGFEEIVVLTGHALPDSRLPESSKVNSSSAFRILETMRIHRMYPKARITISGNEDVPLLMKELMISLGVKEGLIIVENRSRNTFESAVNLKSLMVNREFILVTSAGHMPRSLLSFRQMGMNPAPAPTDYLAKMGPFDGNFLPNVNSLVRSDLAVHEYFGMLWYSLKAYAL